MAVERDRQPGVPIMSDILGTFKESSNNGGPADLRAGSRGGAHEHADEKTDQQLAPLSKRRKPAGLKRRA